MLVKKTVIIGSVLYDPKVAVIWEIISDFFSENGLPVDTVFYTNYELLVGALLDGHVDIAWNSPLAWLGSQRRSGGHCRAIAMRDTDRDRVSYWVVKANSGFQDVSDLRGKTVAVGAKDSPQATLIPLGYLDRQGLLPGKDVQVKRFDLLVGKHGDHIGGELEAFRSLHGGEVAACAMIDLNWQTWTQDGTINPNEYVVLATTERFDHCVFTVRSDFPADLEEKWLRVLFSMSYDNPKHQEMMDMEGLKQWLPARTSGFGPLASAVNTFGFFDEVVS
ncbi:MAG: phosphate/phosphite/phosphonate ABC transporter substrate-binding protein [Chloroflexi bacterium]|nr:phosphate/phosphite/phosphonate ABC transporter substrate-binding protein [Chloroflexota bacterium]